MVAATPVKSSDGGTTAAIQATTLTSPRDPKTALLDSLDAYASIGNRPSSSSADPLDFLNRHYATEAALSSSLPQLREAVSERMEKLDDRISNALQRQSETADSTRRQVERAKVAIQSLHQRVRMVQTKAAQSEKAVMDITKDMKRLDCAKRHLQKTITTLKRLHMLLHAVEQLRCAALEEPHPNYPTAAHLIDATRLLLQHLENYSSRIQPMKLMEIKVKGIQVELHKGIVRGFRIVAFGVPKTIELENASSASDAPQSGDDLSSPGDVCVMSEQNLADATLVIDALGSDTARSFVNEFCKDHLGLYATLFHPVLVASNPNASRAASFKMVDEDDKPPHALDQIERRFAWFRRVLREVEEKFQNFFPPHWTVQYTLTKNFLEQTREHLLALLDGPHKDRDAENATILLKALQKSILFEKEMMVWLQRDYGAKFLGPSSSEAAEVVGDDGEVLEFDDSGRAVAAASAQGIRIKYERKKKEQGKSAAPVVHQTQLEDGNKEIPMLLPLLGIASSSFDDYMAPYIALEEQSMNEQLVESSADSAVDMRGEMPIFTSSTTLFVYIKGSINRCTVLTKGAAFFLLYQSFKDTLRKYASVISSKLPAPATSSGVVGGINIGAVGGLVAAGSKEGNASYKIPPGGEVTVCHVIGTCEYCADTVEALEDLIRDTIDEKYKEQVDMMGEQGEFHDVTAKGIRVLVSGLENRTEPAFKTMTGTNWGTLTTVDEESAYVRAMHMAIQPFVQTVRDLIPSSYFRSFCDKFAMTFTSNYYNTLIRQKRISESGTQQLLLDVYNLKTLLLKLPVMEKGSSAAKNTKTATIAPAIYTKMVSKQFKRIEILLKLVGTPVELLVDVFKAQWVGGTTLDLQIVMNLKGMKRGEQGTILEKMGIDPSTLKAGSVTEQMLSLQEKVPDVAAKVNSDLNQMRQKVDDFRRAFR